MDARLIPASELIPAPVTWFWEGRIPLGALTELIAAPGQAKSSVTYDLAARATTGPTSVRVGFCFVFGSSLRVSVADNRDTPRRPLPFDDLR